MIRFYARLILPPVALFITVMLLIHTQPYDERAPAALLVPVNCRAPCFMGIRPGATTIDQAIILLKKNEWVSQVIAIPNEIHPNQVGWFWAKNAPDYLQKGENYFDGQILPTDDRKVSWISFNTTLKMDDIPLILGDPKEDGLIVGGVVLTTDPQINLIVELWFPAHHLWIRGIKSCPYYGDFGQTPASISITDYDIRKAIRTIPVEVVQHAKLLSSLRSTSLQVCGF